MATLKFNNPNTNEWEEIGGLTLGVKEITVEPVSVPAHSCLKVAEIQSFDYWTDSDKRFVPICVLDGLYAGFSKKCSLFIAGTTGGSSTSCDLIAINMNSSTGTIPSNQKIRILGYWITHDQFNKIMGY